MKFVEGETVLCPDPKHSKKIKARIDHIRGSIYFCLAEGWKNPLGFTENNIEKYKKD